MSIAGPGHANAADINRGSKLYQQHCIACHGLDGTPAFAGAPDLKRGTSLVRSDRQILIAIRGGRGTMPAYFGILNERQILDVIAFLRTLS